MEINAQNKLLLLDPHSLDRVRKSFNLDGPGQMKEAIDTLRDWINKQNHIVKKDFSDVYLENTILSCKGSIERSKLLIDKICTMRTLQSHLFGIYNVKKDFGDLGEHMIGIILPKPLPNDCRIMLSKFYSKESMKNYIMNFFRYAIIFADYLKINDCLSKLYMIYDFRDASLSDVTTSVDFLEFKRHTSVLIVSKHTKLRYRIPDKKCKQKYRHYKKIFYKSCKCGNCNRPQKIFIISTSKLVSTLISILKTILKPKILQRIQVIKSHEELYEHIPRETLPKDYGGDETSIEKLQELWTDVLSSEQSMEILKGMSKAVTDESLRSNYEFNENYAGMAGTFRFLNVD